MVVPGRRLRPSGKWRVARRWTEGGKEVGGSGLRRPGGATPAPIGGLPGGPTRQGEKGFLALGRGGSGRSRAGAGPAGRWFGCFARAGGWCGAKGKRGGFMPSFRPCFPLVGSDLADGDRDVAEHGHEQQEQRPVGRPVRSRFRRPRQVQQEGLEWLGRGAG